MKISSCGIPIINKQNEPKFNCEYFDCIDTEEKAYWLGFVFADGYIASKKSNSKDDYSFELSLAIKDILHLEKFATATGMKSKDCGHRCRLSVKNKHMWNVLNNYGCTPRKSLTLKFPDRSIFKDKSLIRHFIRGYFDGDGCISYANKEHTRPSILLLGTIEFLSDVLIEFGVDRKIHQHHKTKTFEFRFGDIKNCMKFMKYLYADSSVYLDRKKKRFEYFAALRSNP